MSWRSRSRRRVWGSEDGDGRNCWKGFGDIFSGVLAKGCRNKWEIVGLSCSGGRRAGGFLDGDTWLRSSGVQI